MSNTHTHTDFVLVPVRRSGTHKHLMELAWLGQIPRSGQNAYITQFSAKQKKHCPATRRRLPDDGVPEHFNLLAISGDSTVTLTPVMVSTAFRTFPSRRPRLRAGKLGHRVR